MTRPAVFLDRDGVLNEVRMADGVAASPRSVAELVIASGAAEATARLRDRGFVLVGVSNQPDIARGTIERSAVEQMNAYLVESLGLDALEICPHDSHDGCRCRKPLPGMITDAAERLDLQLGAASWLVGDRWVDIAAGRAAGLRTVLLDQPYSWTRTSSGEPEDGLRADVSVSTLSEAADAILGAAAEAQTSRR